MDDRPLLRVRDLRTVFDTDAGVLPAVDEVSFDVAPASTVALVGESGCGKSATALSILRLVPSPPGRIVSGSVELEGRDLLRLTEREMRQVRGNQISMIFQEPMTSLNPVYTVGWQIREPIALHRKSSRRAARERVLELLRMVGLPETSVDAYPHQLSGGQRQRVMIAMALACEPKLLLADEPTTALDVTVQAQILELLRDVQKRLSTGVLLITHDLGVVAENAERAVVMYAGRVVEDAPVPALFRQPRHPYTRGLLESIPGAPPADALRSADASRAADASQTAEASREVRASLEPEPRRRPRLRTIEGLVPDLRRLPPGCRFADRCPLRIERCTREEPPLAEVGPGRKSRCFRAAEVSP
ncbi:MAG: ABC transporter ATP-binding protein [Myxococcales bacterium]|nr:ABC transporter ATP-binding protein [Myxococcales bacterium]